MRKWIYALLGALLALPAQADVTADAGSTAGALAASQSSFESHTNAHYERTDASERAPTIFVPGLAGGTNPCIVSFSAGISAGAFNSMPGIGISGGRAYVDEECNVRETLRLAAALSPKEPTAQQETFLKNIACQSEVMAAALEMTAAEMGDPSMGCAGSLPEGVEVSMRSTELRGSEFVVMTPQGLETDPMDAYVTIMGGTVDGEEAGW